LYACFHISLAIYFSYRLLPEPSTEERRHVYMSIDFTGFDELEKELKRLERNAKELSQITEVSFN
jgi:hypothetical protein